MSARSSPSASRAPEQLAIGARSAPSPHFWLALFTEMCGFSLTIYFLAGWLQRPYPGLEREMLAEFGETYARYAAATPGFVPHLRGTTGRQRNSTTIRNG